MKYFNVKLIDGSTYVRAGTEFGVPGLILGKSSGVGYHVYHVESGRSVGSWWFRTIKDIKPFARECYSGMDWTQPEETLLANPKYAEMVKRFEDGWSYV